MKSFLAEELDRARAADAESHHDAVSPAQALCDLFAPYQGMNRVVVVSKISSYHMGILITLLISKQARGSDPVLDKLCAQMRELLCQAARQRMLNILEDNDDRP